MKANMIIKKLSSLLLISLFSVFSNFIYAMPVSKVYRADSRPPSEVFSSGFHAWGTNINFNAHILGVSGRRGSRNSAFIPTTSIVNRANAFAIDLLNVSRDRRSYVYNIRPTANFYSASTTMYYIYDESKKRVPDDVRSVLVEEQEYSAYQHIPPELIESVTIHERLSDNTISTSIVRNMNYRPDNTTSNEEPFTTRPPGSNHYELTSRPVLIMGLSGVSINNEMPNNSSTLPSPAYTRLVLDISISGGSGNGEL